MRLVPRLPHLPNPKSKAVKRFMARYIYYLEMFGYIAVTLVAVAVVSCFFFKVDDVIRGDAVAIKPQAETIKRKADVLVTRVFVQNHQKVKKGEPLVEVVEDPRWMSRYLIMHQMQSLLDEFQSPGQAAELAKKRIEQAQKEAREAALAAVKKVGPQITETQEEKKEEKPPLPTVALTPEEVLAYTFAAQRVAEWNMHGVRHAPRIVLRAPIAGIVVAADDLEYKRVDADKEILKVVNLDDLRLTPKLGGEKVADARVGEEARVTAIVPDYKNGLVFRGDTVPRGRFFWQKERVTSYGLLDAKIKDTVKDAFKGKKITQRNDIPFNVTEVTDVEVDATVDSSPLDSQTAKGQDGGRAYAASATPAAPNPASPAPIVADAPMEFDLRGKVLEGKHTVVVQIGTVPPDVTKKVREAVAGQIQARVLEAPEEPEAENGTTWLQDLRVNAVQGVRIIAKVKGENDNPKGPTDRLKKEARRTAIRGSTLENQRLYECTVQIQDPPQFLKNRVLELLEDGKEVKAKVEVKTGRRPLAMLLLKR